MRVATVRGAAGRLATTAAVMVGAAVTACGGSSSPPAPASLNTSRVALAIENSILVERHIHAQVACPPTIPQEKGLTFTCIATTYTKKGHHPVATPFTVSQTDSAGHVYYSSPK